MITTIKISDRRIQKAVTHKCESLRIECSVDGNVVTIEDMTDHMKGYLSGITQNGRDEK